MALKAFMLTPGGGLKSLPLNAVPPEAWHSLTGDAQDSNNRLSLYKKVPWLFRSVDLVADALASLPWDFHELNNGKVVEDPELPFVFDLYETMNAAAGDFYFYAAIYWHKGINRARLPTQLKRMHPSTITPKYDDDKGLVLFERRYGNRTIDIAVDDMAYAWKVNRAAELGPGTPPVVAALTAAGLLDYIDIYGTNWFGNGAVETTLLFLDGNPADAEIQKVEGWIQRSATSIKKAWRILGVRFKPEPITLGQTPDKMALPELTTSKREDIATALGVPQSLLFSNAANFATSRQDDIHFYDKTIKPLANRIGEVLSDDVFSAFGLELKPHPERLEIFQTMEAEKAEALTMMINSRVITANEYRSAMDYDERDDPLFDEPGIPRRETNEDEEETPPPDDTQQAQQLLELRKFQRFVEKRVKAGKSLSRSFETSLLPTTLTASIEGALEGVKTPDQVKPIFKDAERWLSYP